MYYHESATILTSDDIQFKTWANEHPSDFILAIPKYIPTDKIRTTEMQLRVFDGKEYNRFNSRSVGTLKDYFSGFRENYGGYIRTLPERQTWFMGIPKEKIVKEYDSRKGMAEIMEHDKEKADPYLLKTIELIEFMLDNGMRISDFGATNSTLIGNYTPERSDIDYLVYGRDKYWKVMEVLENEEHPKIRWRTNGEWRKHYVEYNAGLNFTADEYLYHSKRKKSDGLYDNTVFSFFGVSKEGEEPVKWGEEEATPIGQCTIEATVSSHYHSCVRPGFYGIEGVKIIDGSKEGLPEKIVTYSRSLLLHCLTGERIRAHGLLEKVNNRKNNREHHQITIGYLESYEKRKGTEYIKVIQS